MRRARRVGVLCGPARTELIQLSHQADITTPLKPDFILVWASLIKVGNKRPDKDQPNRNQKLH
jgi:hypothetical protein